jgi:hypothetical protein
MKLTEELERELYRARELYPDFPRDLIHQVAIMAEESGETVRAALNHVYHDAPLEDVRAELVQTGAMVLRCLEAVDMEIKQGSLF